MGVCARVCGALCNKCCLLCHFPAACSCVPKPVHMPLPGSKPSPAISTRRSPRKPCRSGCVAGCGSTSRWLQVAVEAPRNRGVAATTMWRPCFRLPTDWPRGTLGAPTPLHLGSRLTTAGALTSSSMVPQCAAIFCDATLVSSLTRDA